MRFHATFFGLLFALMLSACGASVSRVSSSTGGNVGTVLAPTNQTPVRNVMVVKYRGGGSVE